MTEARGSTTMVLAFLAAFVVVVDATTNATTKQCPENAPSERVVDNCFSDTDCIISNRGLHCCSYCDQNTCEHYCRGEFGTNGDARNGDNPGQCPTAQPAASSIDSVRFGCNDGIECFREGRGTLCCTVYVNSTYYFNYCHGYATNVTILTWSEASKPG